MSLPLQTADVLLKRINKSYWIKAPIDAIDNIIGLMEPEHFERYEKILLKVFSGENETPGDPNDPFNSGHFNSTELQTGLALNFCILAYRGAERKKLFCGISSKIWVAEVFNKLNQEVDFLEFIRNKPELLGYFAEAAPDAFMDALEKCLQGNKEGIKSLLTIGEDEFSFFGHNHATGLLWTLKKLAWIPEYFERVVYAFVTLNHLNPDPNGNIHPRPSSSFKGLFVTFSPQTSVDWKERIRILKGFLPSQNNSLFPLIISSLPKSHNSVTCNPKPIFGRYEQQVITNKDHYNVNEAMFECALARTEGIINRINTLIDHLPEMSDGIFANAISQLKNEGAKFSSENKQLLWKKLRNTIVRHSRFPDANWVMSKERLKELSEWRNALPPLK